MIEIDHLGIDELTELQAAVQSRIQQLQVVASIPDQIRALQVTILNATGREAGTEWRQPEGSHDAYPEGWEVTHAGKRWLSITPDNVHAPGVSGWRQLVEEGAHPDWVQPAGAHDAYKTGDTVTHGGKTWRSTSDGNVWEPDVYGWVEI